MTQNLGKKTFVLGIILLFIAGVFVPCSQSVQKQMQENSLMNNEQTSQSTEYGTVTCYCFGKTRNDKQEIILSTDEATLIFEKLDELKSEITQAPYSENVNFLKTAFVELLDEKGLLPNSDSKEAYRSLLNPKWVQRLQNREKQSIFPQPFVNRGTTMLCSVGGQGRGLLIPLFLLPRPRISMLWFGDGVTLAANLLTSRGYVAGGAQAGFTLGFMGIGISYALPGYTLYGFIGYALLATTTAEYVEYYPPNRAPEISDIQPGDGQQNVPLTLSELQFRIQDADRDLMSYSVTTEPDIGSASGNLKPFGVYKVPVSGLMDLTSYTWYIQVTDGKETTEKICKFTTEAIAPIVSNPLPADGERDVPMDLSMLQFTLKDYQGDTMEYTVETSPNIGSRHETGVHDGTYTVPISGMTYGATYRWFVNVTDGAHWTRKVFTFETGYPSQFDPFDYGWSYRKQITINHTQVLDTLEDFPVLISRSDADLSLKAQEDGGDIMFMNDIGVSTRVYHDLEFYYTSSGTLITWLKIPFVSSINDTVLYMYYGNPDCINQAYPKKTWDLNYKAVWHMNDATPMTITDSTLHNYSGTKIAPNQPQECVGKIGSAQDFNGINDNIWINDQSVLGIGEKTISFWMKRDANSNYQTVMTNALGGTKNDAGLDIAVDVPKEFISMAIGNGQTTGHYLFLNNPLPDYTTYHYYVFRQSGSNLSIYLDGALYGWTTQTSGSESLPSHNMSFGRSHQNPPYFYWFDGQLDEIRMSDIARSASWVNTEYNNQHSPSTFLFIGPEESHP
jgi:hypothetical protein